MKSAWLGASLFLAACGAEPPTGTPAFVGLNFVGDTKAPALQPRRQALQPQPRPDGVNDILFVNFGGALVQSGSDNAPTNVSQIAGNAPGGTAQIPPFGQGSAPKLSLQDATDAVFDRLQTFFLPYNVTLTTTRPAAGPYTMILVGGTHSLVGEPAGVAGVSATVDCGNAVLSNVVYTFSDDLTPMFGGVVSVAIAAAHETGHSYGLEHTDNPLDIMFSVDPATLSQTLQQLFLASFTTTGNFSAFNGPTGPTAEVCGRANPLDNDVILKAVLGARTGGDMIKPTLTWDSPPQGPQFVPLKLLLSFTASDDVSVKKIEVYNNLELIAVLKTPPYDFTLTVAEGDLFALTAEAVDDAGNRTTLSRVYSASAKYPDMCIAGQTTCPAGRTCTKGFCVLPFGATCKLDTDCVSGVCKPAATTPICTQTCSAFRACPAGSTCTKGLCAPNGTMMMGNPLGAAMNGAACMQGSDCASGRCQDTCLSACDDATPCDGMNVCTPVSGGMGCVAPVDMPKSGGCSYGGRGAPTAPGMLLLLALLAWPRRRMRAARTLSG